MTDLPLAAILATMLWPKLKDKVRGKLIARRNRRAQR